MGKNGRILFDRPNPTMGCSACGIIIIILVIIIIIIIIITNPGNAVAQLVEALRYKPEGCEFDSR
jgi:hypothetical protein